MEGLRRRDVLWALTGGAGAAESLYCKPPVDSVPDDPTGLTGIRWDGEEMERFVWMRSV